MPQACYSQENNRRGAPCSTRRPKKPLDALTVVCIAARAAEWRTCVGQSTALRQKLAARVSKSHHLFDKADGEVEDVRVRHHGEEIQDQLRGSQPGGDGAHGKSSRA